MREKCIIVFCKQEGCSGVSYVGEFDTEFSAKAMAEDVNAIARAAKRRGLKTVIYSPREIRWVKKSFSYRNYVDEDVIVVNAVQVSEYIENCVGVVSLGISAKAGTLNAFSCGTNNHVAWHDYTVMGESVGEIGIYRVFAAKFGVPMIAVIGDEAVCKEAKRMDEKVFVYATKTASTRNVAECKDVQECRLGIEECVYAALAEREEIAVPKITFPLKATITFNRTDFCDDAFVKSFYSLEREGARVLSKTLNDLKFVYELFF